MNELTLKGISFEPTGDPFVDTGALVLKALHNRFPQKSLMEVLTFVTDVYLINWKQKLHSVFHTNSKLLNPSTKGKHRENTIQYLKGLVDNKSNDSTIQGFCKICGNKSTLFQNSREFYPLTGSGAFVNFHHGHEEGSYLCNVCSLKLYLLPLGVLQMGGSVGLLQVQTDFSRKYVEKNIVEVNLDKIGKNTSEGILKSDFSNPKNALFHFATEIIRAAKDENASETLQLFHFTNFGAAPFCDIYVLPSPVFRFLNKVINYQPRAWHYFVNRYFRIKKAEWDWENGRWLQKKKNEEKTIEENEYLNNPNHIYERLLAGQSILKQVLKIHREHFKRKKEPFPLDIAIYYVKEVLHMDNKQIQLIRRIGDAVFELAQKENNFKKYLVLLEGASRSYQLRSALLKIVKERYKSGEKEPLIRLQEYVEYLFPDGQAWGEVRDLMLIYLYERLHDANIEEAEIPEEIAPAEEDINETL
ncbi:type I-B CRISPR-associated protein Cas8b1/Cst1 [Caldithrix abyssi]